VISAKARVAVRFTTGTLKTVNCEADTMSIDKPGILRVYIVEQGCTSTNTLLLNIIIIVIIIIIIMLQSRLK